MREQENIFLFLMLYLDHLHYFSVSGQTFLLLEEKLLNLFSNTILYNNCVYIYTSFSEIKHVHETVAFSEL